MDLTNREAYLKAKKYLSTFKENTFFDSEIYLLLMKANSYSNFTELINNFDEKSANLYYFERNLKKLASGEPIQYIIKEAPFFDLNISVNRNVLIPRPETEGLVDLTIKLINNNKLNHKYIADICTGSGCIALYLKKTYPLSTIFATDKYQDAITVAKHNFNKYNKEIILLEGDKLEPIIDRDIKLDVLISNPPYVSNMDDIEDKVKKYEPISAVYSNDGTIFYETYFKYHKKVMNPKFLMAFEINYDQEERLTFLINKYFDTTKIKYNFYKDIYDKTRYLIIEGNYDESIE